MKRFMYLSIGVLCLSLVHCTTAPKEFQFEPSTVINGDFDDVWSAVVEYFAIGNLPIETIEKDSGLIVTSWMDASRKGAKEDKALCDCGSAGAYAVDYTSGRFSVFVKSVEGGTQLRVTCTFKQGRGNGTMVANCNSTGKLETAVQDYVRAKVAAEPIESVPSFKPGENS